MKKARFRIYVGYKSCPSCSKFTICGNKIRKGTINVSPIFLIVPLIFILSILFFNTTDEFSLFDSAFGGGWDDIGEGSGRSITGSDELRSSEGVICDK